ncbi:MAG: hypothetical protein F4X19_09855, partial [Acidobacteria bacterium]|nr:hypothetical protein [Acidobacteriota bacterium]
TAELTFTGTAGETKTFTVATTEDTDVEADETFTVGLAVSGTAETVTATSRATGTITDDDGSAAVTIADASANEGDAITFVVTLDKAVSGGLTVTPSYTDGTATSGTDYTENTAALTFTGTAGETQSFTVATTEDTDVEADETFTVSLAVSGTTAKVTATDTATGTITDHNGGAAVTIADARASEGDEITFTVTLNQAVQGGLTVTPGFTDRTATSGTDYTENTAALTFIGTAGETQSFTVATIEDGVVEAHETFTVSLAVLGTTATVTATDTATGTITNDDTAAVTVADASASEGDAITFTARLAKAVAGGLTLRPGYTDVTATKGTDYTENTALITFIGTAGETQTFAVATIEDRVVETDETFTVSLGVSGVPEGTTVTVGSSATGTITNDDGGGGNNEKEDTEYNSAPVALDDSITVSRGGSTSILSNEYRSVYRVNRDVYQAGWTGDLPDDANNDWDPSWSPLTSFFPESSVLANDSDLEDRWNQLSVELIAGPDHGNLTLNRDGTFTYVHDGTRTSQEDHFTYRVMDSVGALSNEATVTITVTGVNAGPEGEPIPDQVLMLGKDGTVDLASYFTDPDGDPLSYEARASDGSSTVEVHLSESTVVLTPVAVASTRVTVTARDPGGLSAEQTFGVRVETVQERRSRLLELSLAAFGRTVASQAVDAIGQRFEESSRDSGASFSGQRFDFNGPSEGEGRSRVAEWLQGLVSSQNRGSFRSEFVIGTPAAGRPVPGQWDMAGRQRDNRTVFSHDSSLTGGSRGGGIGVGSLQMATPSGSGFSHFSGRSLMTGSSFQYAPDRKGSRQASNWMLWGQGVRSDFYGQPQSELRLDGRVGAAYLGADRRWGSKVVVGVAASHSVGALDYANGGDGENEMEVGARLTGAHPYVKWSPRPGLDLWSLLGYGRGAAELDVAGEPVEMGIDVRMAALGGRSELTRLGSVDLALKADAFAVSVGSEAVEGLKVGNGDTQRTRLVLEGRTDWSLSSDSILTPSLEVGARMDGGDAETGLGAELAGGASFANRRLGLVVEARGHWLMAHQDRNFKEQGARLSVRLDPGADGKGWGFSLAPLWGNSSGGAGTLWRSEQMSVGSSRADRRRGVHWQPNRTQAALSYGMETWGGRGRLGPFARMELDREAPRLGGGLQMDVLGTSGEVLERVPDGLRLELFGDYQRRRQGGSAGLAAGPAGSYDYRFGIGFVLNF